MDFHQQKTINILFFSSLAYLGNGGQESLLQLVSRLDRSIFSPEVIVPATGSLADRLLEESICVHVLKLPRLSPANIGHILKVQKRLLSIIEQRRIDILHTDGPRNTIYAGIAGRLKRKPVVWHVRTSDRDPYDGFLYALASKLILVANALKARFPFKSQLTKCVTIHNGVDLDFYCPNGDGESDRSPLGLQPEDFIILVAARIEEGKGQHLLIKACGRLKHTYPHLRILFAGKITDQSYLRRCIQFAENEGIKEKVRFLGQVKDVRGLLRLSDIFVLPSTRSEAFSRSILEAMATAKPVIATDVGGAREAIESSACGFIVPPESSSALARKIALLIEKDDLRRQIGSQARKRAMEWFGIQANVERTVQTYMEIIQTKKMQLKQVVKSKHKAAYLKLRKHLLTVLTSVCRSRCLVVETKMPRFKKILFLRFDRIGDMVLSTPALKALKKAYPEAVLTVLASRANFPVIMETPHVDDIIIYDSSASVAEKVRLFRSLRSMGFDLVVDPMIGHDISPAAIAYLTNAKVRIGFAGFGREAFFTLSTEVDPAGCSIGECHISLLRLLRIRYSEIEPKLYLKEKETEGARRWIQEVARHGERVIGLHPGAHYETQRWAGSNFAALTQLILENSNYKAVLIGGVGDASLIREMQSLLGESVPVLISGDLRKSIGAISQMDTLVCNNSGPLHIASALNVPTVSFMGPTVKNHWMPTGNDHRVLRVDDLDCIGCNSGVCYKGTRECMQRITPKMAWQALKTLLEKRAVGRGV